MDPTRFDRMTRLLAARKVTRRAAVRSGGAGLAASIGAFSFGRVSAQDATPAASEGVGREDEPIDLLFVQSFGSGNLQPKEGDAGAYTLTLSQAAASTL